MGAKQISSQVSINHQQWDQKAIDSHYRHDYGQYQIFKNKISGKVIEKYDIFINDQEQFQQFEKVLLWRNQCEYIVGIDYRQFQRQQQICSTGYNGQIFIPHMPLRLSDITDIPFPQNLYVLLATLKGFQYLYSFPFMMQNFPINQNLICVNQKGQVKVWMNANLSYNFSDKFRKQHITQQQVLKSIIELVQQNTDIEGNPYQFRQYLNDRKVSVNGDFNQVIKLLHNYSNQMNTKIPLSLNSVKQLLHSDANLNGTGRDVSQSLYGQYKHQNNQNLEQLTGYRNQLGSQQSFQQSQQIMARTIRPYKQPSNIRQMSFHQNSLPDNRISHLVNQNSHSVNQNSHLVSDRQFSGHQNRVPVKINYPAIQKAREEITNQQGSPLNYRNMQTPSFGHIKDSYQDIRSRSIGENYVNKVLFPNNSKKENFQNSNLITEFTFPQRVTQNQIRNRQQENLNLQAEHKEIQKSLNQYKQSKYLNQNNFISKNTSFNYPHINKPQPLIVFNRAPQPQNLFYKPSNIFFEHYQPTAYVKNNNNTSMPSQIRHQPVGYMNLNNQGKILQKSVQYPQIVRSASTQKDYNTGNNFNQDHFAYKINSSNYRKPSNVNFDQRFTGNISVSAKNDANLSNNGSVPTKDLLVNQGVKLQQAQQRQEIQSKIDDDLWGRKGISEMKYFLNKDSEEALDPDIAADLAKYLNQT